MCLEFIYTLVWINRRNSWKMLMIVIKLVWLIDR